MNWSVEGLSLEIQAILLGSCGLGLGSILECFLFQYFWFVKNIIYSANNIELLRTPE